VKLVALVLAWLCAAAPALARPTESLKAERAAATAELRDLERRAGSLEDQLGLRRRVLRRRVRALYKMSQGGAFRLVVDARNLDDLDERVIAARRVVERDLEEVGALDEELAELGRDRDRREQALARDAAPEATREPSAAPTGLSRARGALSRPVPGPIVLGLGRTLVREPRAGAPALELPRRAVDLASSEGAPVHAIAAGTVRWIGEIEGVGRAVIVDHGDRYVSVTGRLTRVRVHPGAHVREDETLGHAAGDTISFELTEGTMPLDPAHWLRPPPAPAPIPMPAALDAASSKAATLMR
jgi:septal ring factor EnvC (AmiA/AmiB activator)